MGTKKKENFIKEINDVDEWNTLCQLQGGLTVVDIYSEWAGPCNAMVASLKKIKLEVGDDSLNYAMARVDTIPALQMFREHCMPTWLFIASGEPVAVVHGSNASLLKTMIAEHMERERKIAAGSEYRKSIELRKAVPLKKFLSIDLEDGEKKPEKVRTDPEKCSPGELQSFVLVLLNHGARTDLNVFNRIKEIFQDEGILFTEELVLEFRHEDFLDYELPEAECDALAGEKYCLLKLRKNTSKANQDSPLEEIIANIPDLTNIYFKPENVILRIVSGLLEAPHQLIVFISSENWNSISTRAEQNNIIVLARRRRAGDTWDLEIEDEKVSSKLEISEIILLLAGREQDLVHLQNMEQQNQTVVNKAENSDDPIDTDHLDIPEIPENVSEIPIRETQINDLMNPSENSKNLRNVSKDSEIEDLSGQVSNDVLENLNDRQNDKISEKDIGASEENTDTPEADDTDKTMEVDVSDAENENQNSSLDYSLILYSILAPPLDMINLIFPELY
ncbi:thioredoxin domain-containing protein 3 [Eurytemora carolleeae]|uniref:thioredoxin domain-containing protein 3 n=1 Tax=Eurytemora carolleeae TaxID=1294199 RepID=UPI000C7876D9|nr:thioredoxin domain-containing protein 3 [Eurytemora carolleeae]|eukprot:XP_023328601.1 thioredoxin domain-containing protein 3-like [Eurytemora affinis]